MMKKLLFLALITLIAFGACKSDGATETSGTSDAHATESATTGSKDARKNASYALGMSISNSLKGDGIEVDYARLYKGMNDAFAAAMEIDEKEIPVLIQSYIQDSSSTVEKSKASYAFGCSIGKNFQVSGLGDVDVNEFEAGVNDVMSGQKLKFEMVKIDSIVKAYQKEELAGDGIKFLAENAKKEGIKTTATGLQYKVIKEGTGKQPKGADRVTVHYTGTLIDGTKFDSSVDRGKPATFPLNGVIPGWTEGLQLMKEGAKYQFFIPYELGYGERGAGAQIPPFATLIFDVELIKIEDAPAPGAPK